MTKFSAFINHILSKGLLLFLFSLLFFGCTSNVTEQSETGEQNSLTVFLVRHGEKASLTKDPELSEAGKERAIELAKVLSSANIKHVHSSDYIRTRETAAPTANTFGVKTELYDPKNLGDLLVKLKKQGGTHLVVGHSTTTPKMVELLGGSAGTEINELGEFDRLYVVMDSGCGNIQSTLLRYGTPFRKQE